MENLLDKDIFNDNDLFKLAPDYNPSNILLRMQARTAVTKDTHSHGVFKNVNMQRKTTKRPKNNFGLNKEIAKIRNSFNNMNLKNKIMLKHALKYDSSSLNNLEYNEDLSNVSVLDTNLLYESPDTTDLILCNDNEFKLITRPEKINFQEKNDKTKRTQGRRIKVNSIDPQKQLEQVNEPNTTDDIQVCSSQIIHDQQGSELQTLLIMMAISSKSIDSNDDKCGDEIHENYEIEERNIIESLPSNEITNILNVIPLRIEISIREKYISKKYVQKWRDYISKKKEYYIQQRHNTINIFFDKLEKKKININQPYDMANKSKQQAQDFNTYQHRYKVQKHIIALQKVKLEEQNRIIEELKYNKIVEASKQSVDAMRDEVRKAYYELDRHLKPKIKCLTNELKMADIEEPSLVLHCLKVPQFLQRMEKRAREREEKHAMIRERRRQMEEERIRLKQQAEMAKTEMDKEEKMKRIKELKEKRKREKVENIRRKQYAERIRALIVMADLHYEKNLMSKYGIRPLRALIEIKRDNIEKAKSHYTFQLKKNIFLNWMWYTEDMWFERNYKAEDFYRKKILGLAFQGFKKNHYEYVLKQQVAEDYYDLYVTQLTFKRWLQGIQIIRKENEIKWRKAVVYNNCNLLFKTFTCWRSLPALNALKREQEARKLKWREKVLQVVPDYTPPED